MARFAHKPARTPSTKQHALFLALLVGSTSSCFASLGGPSEYLDADDGALSDSCGDEALDAGEGCDDGNLRDGDGCSPSCQVEPGWRCESEPSRCVNLCGNSTIDEGEACDGDELDEHSCATIAGGFTGGTLACTAQCAFDTTECVLASCGNNVVDDNEECDDGNASNQDACLSNCREATCGDGYEWSGHEECDDGNTSNQDACLSLCLAASCGDGYQWAGQEECDDGATTSGDGCTSTCVLEYCGDSVVQPGIGEECEGGVQACTTTCTSTGQASCQASCRWGICVPPAEICNGTDEDCDGIIDFVSCLSTVYRFYNPSTGDHMFKVNDTTPAPGYVAEVANNWRVYANQVPGTEPIYQVSNGTDHMLSGSPTEGEAVGYVLVATIGYAASPDSFSAAGLAPSLLCRYYNPTNGDHFTYLDTVVDGYIKEGCYLYVWDFH